MRKVTGDSGRRTALRFSSKDKKLEKGFGLGFPGGLETWGLIKPGPSLPHPRPLAYIPLISHLLPALLMPLQFTSYLTSCSHLHQHPQCRQISLLHPLLRRSRTTVLPSGQPEPGFLPTQGLQSKGNYFPLFTFLSILASQQKKRQSEMEQVKGSSGLWASPACPD